MALIFAGACWLVAGLALGRLLFEGFFPLLSWLGRPAGALTLAGGISLLAVAYYLFIKPAERVSQQLIWWPLLLNLPWLLDPAVNLVNSRLWAAGSVWLILVLAAHVRLVAGQPLVLAGDEFAALRTRSSGFYLRRIPPLRSHGWLIFLALMPLYLVTLGRTVGAADTFEFQVVTPRLGIVHPTGYPLYLLLGRLWTLLPVGPVAWRLNLGTAVYGLAACLLLYFVILDLLRLLGLNRVAGQASLAALFAAFTFAIGPTFWSQTVEAEVYTLHLLIVTAALWLMVRLFILVAGRKVPVPTLHWLSPGRALLLLAAVIGLGLTHHLTAVFLLPPAALAVFLAHLLARDSRAPSPLERFRQKIIPLLAAFVLPLTLYAYLPLRWRAVNDEGMGLGRLLDWVTGGRFQGALQLWGWWEDPTRMVVVSRLFLAEWPWWLLLPAALGSAILFWRHWRLGGVTLLTWGGFTFYCLNYYVPDLSVFLLPAHLVLAVWLGVTAAAAIDLMRLAGRYIQESDRPAGRFFNPRHRGRLLFVHLAVLALAAPLALAVNRYPAADASQPDGRVAWGSGVLQRPLDPGAAVLADSDKFPPLYYLQQAEGLRPDLDIMVLPDEAAYRAELDRRLAAGQTVYLARFLPGLAAAYHLRSAGPLVEVATAPLDALPSSATPLALDLGPVNLAGYRLERPAPEDPQAVGVTLYWRAAAGGAGGEGSGRQLYLRWAGRAPFQPAGVHPAGNTYPFAAWRAGEIVPDFYLLPLPHHPSPALDLEVALAPPFTPAAELDWRPVATLDLGSQPVFENLPDDARPVRWQFGGAAVTAVALPEQIRPGSPFTIQAAGPGSIAVQFEPIPLEPAGLTAAAEGAGLAEGVFEVRASRPREEALCGWLRAPADDCTAGRLRVSGLPLPAEAINFGDRIALLDYELGSRSLTPGGALDVNLRWQALAPIPVDYTVFVQLVDEQDRIVSQVDAFPLHGTFPTSQWEPGEIVADPYRLPLPADLPPGRYRLLLGFYNLADLQRLPILDPDGRPLDDKFIIPDLTG